MRGEISHDSKAGHATLLHQFLARGSTAPDAVAYAVWPRGASAITTHLTWGAWADASRRVAGALIEAGVQPGECVLIFADNCPMWPIVDQAVQMVGGISVGAYPTSSVVQLSAQIRDCAAHHVFVDGVARRAMVEEACVTMSWTVQVWAHDDWQRACIAPHADAELVARLDAISAADDAMLIYTSGSMGEPKGARISHRYLSTSAASIVETLGLMSHDTGVSFLPFCHAAERVFGLAVRIATGMSAVLVESPNDVWAAMRVFEPTLFGGLPRMFEKLAERLRDASSADDATARWQEMLGRQCRLATSGGAALPQPLAERLAAAGLPVLGAYGQTEHLCVAMNRPGAHRFDAVGQPMPGTDVRIADDGELLVRRNALTFSGYHGQPEATRAAFTDDGVWLRTGDLAEQDDDGMLRITGRLKDLLALSNGKKVAPSPIELELSASPLIASAVCIGEGRHFLSAVLQLQRDVAASLVHSHGLSVQWPELAQHNVVRAAVQLLVDEVNIRRSRPEQVRRFTLVSDDWTVENDALTPTFKLRRRAIEARYRSAIDAMYLTGDGGNSE